MELIPKLRAKIHLMTVTHAAPDYEGSITLPADVMKAAGLKEYDMVHVNCKDSGEHWETYCIPGEEGQVKMNGAAAQHFNIGDKIHILAYAFYTERADEIEYGTNKRTEHKHRAMVVYCDDQNRLISNG